MARIRRASGGVFSGESLERATRRVREPEDARRWTHGDARDAFGTSISVTSFLACTRLLIARSRRCARAWRGRFSSRSRSRVEPSRRRAGRARERPRASSTGIFSEPRNLSGYSTCVRSMVEVGARVLSRARARCSRSRADSNRRARGPGRRRARMLSNDACSRCVHPTCARTVVRPSSLAHFVPRRASWMTPRLDSRALAALGRRRRSIH